MISVAADGRTGCSVIHRKVDKWRGREAIRWDRSFTECPDRAVKKNACRRLFCFKLGKLAYCDLSVAGISKISFARLRIKVTSRELVNVMSDNEADRAGDRQLAFSQLFAVLISTFASLRLIL